MEAVGRGPGAGMDAAFLLRHTAFLLGRTAGNSFAWKRSIGTSGFKHIHRNLSKDCSNSCTTCLAATSRRSLPLIWIHDSLVLNKSARPTYIYMYIYIYIYRYYIYRYTCKHGYLLMLAFYLMLAGPGLALRWVQN